MPCEKVEEDKMDKWFHLFIGLGMAKSHRPETPNNFGIIRVNVRGVRLVFFEETPDNPLTAEARMQLFHELEQAQKEEYGIRCTLYLGCRVPSARDISEITVLLREDSQSSEYRQDNLCREGWRLWTCDCNLSEKAKLIEHLFPFQCFALILPCAESPLKTIKIDYDRSYHNCTKERLSNIEVLKREKPPKLTQKRKRWKIY